MRKPKIIVEVKDYRGVVANLYKADKHVQELVGNAQEYNARRTVTVGRRIAPASVPGSYPGAGTQRLRRSIGYRMSPKRLAWTVLCKPEIFAREGFPYYPLWVHEGTQNVVARPFLRQTYEILKPEYTRNVGNAVKKGLR